MQGGMMHSFYFFRSKKVRFVPLVSLLVTLAVSGCNLYGEVGGDYNNESNTLPPLLAGAWTAFYAGVPLDGYTITDTEITYGDGGAGGGSFDYTGTIRFVSNFDAASGVVIIEYTIPPSYPGYNGLSFFAVYYRDLSAGSVRLANATTLSDFSAPDTATLEEAKAKFTRMSMGSYVDWSAAQPYARQ
jgi:hypothetical protein